MRLTVHSLPVQVLLALQRMHSLDMVHCDVKPDNVIWFRCAKAAMTQTCVPCGHMRGPACDRG